MSCSFCFLLWRFRNSMIIILTPILFLPLAILGQSPISSCGYVVCIMAMYWTTEACPLSVTSLLPVVLFPLFGIQSVDAVSMNYMKHICFLLIGTFVLSIAIEEWGLHRRFALRVLLLFGSEPRWIMLGLMLITAFLSMWLSNTSTSALMHPITAAVCREIKLAAEKKEEKIENPRYNQGKRSEIETTKEKTSDSDCQFSDSKFIADTNDDEINECEQKKNLEDMEDSINSKNNEYSNNIEKAMLLAVTYASTLGGMCTTVGTPSNLIGLGIFSSTYGEDAASNVNFANWLAFCLPLSAICLFITWIWIQLRFLNIRNIFTMKKAITDKSFQHVLRKNYDSLPPMGFAEIAVVIHFLVLILLWFFRDPKIFSGWKVLFPGSYAQDSTCSVIVALSVFLFPSKYSSFSWLWQRGIYPEETSKPSPPLLSWKTFQEKCPWDVMLLLGAGFAVASACVESGLSEWFGQKLVVLSETPAWVVLLVLSITISIMTEFVGNAATNSIFLPMFLGLAKDLQINPIAILLVTTLSCSFAYSLPIATPPNALAFSYGSLRIVDMVTTGIPLNLLCVGLLNVFVYLTGTHIFALDTIPEWAAVNATAINITATS